MLRSINESLRLAGPHRTRPIRFLRPERVGEWRLKLYSITTHGAAPRQAFLDEVTRRAQEVYPAPFEGERYGVGFVTAHDAATACIVLFYWWQSFNELHQRIFVGPKDEPKAMTRLADQAAGCVWELEVVDFERRAWLSEVLANPAGPDVERYLERRVDTEILMARGVND